jgi:flagellar biosynthesis protein FlhF
MRLKTYFASGVDAAMNMARAELGPDAMLVHSKRTTPENLELGAFEVVFAIAGDLPVVTPKPTTAGDMLQVQTPWIDQQAQAVSAIELTGLREAVDLTLRLVRRSEALLSAQSKDGDLADLASALEAAGFSGEFRSKALQGMRGILQEGKESNRSALTNWLLRQTRVQPQLGKPGSPRKCILLAGPPGAGKTSTLVKLAARFGVTGRRPAQILSLDAEKIGAADGLRAYANVLGIGFQLLDSAHALHQSLNEHINKELILIDTPGFTASHAATEREIPDFLTGRNDIDVALVLNATTSASILRQQEASFRAWAPAKLIFTRLDEVGESLGALLETSIESGLPLSFSGTGQNTPEDLEEANAAAYCSRVAPDWLDATSPNAGSRKEMGERSRRAAA